MKPEKKRTAWVKRSVLVPSLLYAVLFLACAMIPVLTSVPDSVKVEAGDISTETITATRDIVDKYSTELLKQEEMQKVEPVYKMDDSVMGDVAEAIAAEFVTAESVRAQAQKFYLSGFASQIGGSTVNFDADAISWESALTDIQLEALRQTAGDLFEDNDIFIIAAMGKTQLETLRDVVTEHMRVYMSDGVMSDEIDSTIESIRSDIVAGGVFNSEQAALASHILQDTMKANMIYDKESNEELRQAAADGVQDVVYKKGQNIVQKGEIVSEAQIQLINELGLNQNDDVTMTRYITSFTFMLVLFFVGIFYIAFLNPRLIHSIKLSLNIVVMTLLSILLAVAARRVDLRLLPAFLPIILATAVFNMRTAMAYGVFVSIVTSVMLTPSSEFIFSAQVMTTMLASVMGGAVAIMILRKQDHRGRYVVAGTAAGIVAALVYVCYGYSQGAALSDYLKMGVIALGSGFVCGVASVGLLPLWEVVFSIMTPTKLLELADPSRPLLKRLMIEAPGTYHHSIMTANLAEAACEAIGANEMLARVAAYYHDIGKLNNPIMYKENQLGVNNPHDQLSPEQSARIIIEHVIDGERTAERYKVPAAVREIIVQHHGDSVAYYFYQKALAQNHVVDIQDFQYPGPKPQTREAAIVMLADMVEAAIRANGEYNKEAIHCSIEKLIRARLDEGQLNESPLTMKDLKKIGNAFEAVFFGAYHERIKYPEQIKEGQA